MPKDKKKSLLYYRMMQGSQPADGVNYLAFDTFTDSDATDLEDHTPDVGGPWDEEATGAYQISGNAVVPQTAGDNLQATLPTGTDNFTVMVTITAGGNNGFNVWGISVNHDIPLNRGYRFIINVTNQSWSLFRNDGSEVPLDTDAFTVTPGNDYELKVIKNGSSIECFINGSSVTTQSDGTYTTQSAGIYSYDDSLPNGVIAFDNFAVT
jgi:hypothetical protein